MTNVLDIMIDRLTAVPERLEDIVMDAAAKEIPLIEELNREQLESGFNSAGRRLRQYKSFKYAEEKHAMNPAPGFGNPDLKVKGDFYRGIKARRKGKVIELEGRDAKTNELEETFGFQIIGLSQESISEVGFFIKPEVINRVKFFLYKR